MLLSTTEVKGLGANVSAVEVSVVWGVDVLKNCDAVFSSITPRLVVNSCADVGALVRGVHWVVASTCTWFLFVVVAPSVGIRGPSISGWVGESCFPAVVCAATGPVIRTAVLGSILEAGA